MALVIPKGMYSSDGYGGKYIKSSTARYYWGEGSKPVTKDWEPKAVIPQLETLIDVFDKTFIAVAGGAVLGSYAAAPYGDIDVFPLSNSAIEQAKQLLTNLGYKETDSSEFSIIFKRPGSHNRDVQLVLLHVDTNNKIQALLDRFDLTICQVAVYGKKLHTNSIALEDIKSGVIRVNKTLNIYSTVSRIDKYQTRGFGILDTPIKDPGKNENEKKNMG